MRRVDIKVGFSCNNNCLFCAQAHNKGKGEKTTVQIQSELSKARQEGCDGVVFTGGEVTIRKDLFDLIRYSKQIGFSTIQLQSNCRMLAYMKSCKQAIEAGATEFSPALHGHTREIHDLQTQSKGSFDQTVQAIKNLKSLGALILTNSVITKYNYKFLPELAELLVNLGVNQFQLAFVHPVGNAEKFYDDIVPNMSEAAPFIHKALQIGIDAGIICMAEAMPYCLMKGYEKNISENIIPDTTVYHFGYVDQDYTNSRIEEGKSKFPQCKECLHDKVCEGPWKEYPEKFGHDEFRPVKS